MAKFKVKPKIPDAEKENTERWLLTYADMITLLMLFFIVLWSMSQTDPKKFDEITEALRNALSGSHFGYVFTASNTASSKSVTPLGAAQRDPVKAVRERRDALKVLLENRLKTIAPPIRFEIRESNDGLRLTLMGTSFFEPGSAKLTEEMKTGLSAVASNLWGIPNNIRFEGHADPQPDEPTTGPDNWQLSSDRSLSVLRYFQAQGITPDRLQALAFGQYKNLEPAETPEKRAYDRRVDIVILWDKQSDYPTAEVPGKNPTELNTGVPGSAELNGESTTSTSPTGTQSEQ